MTLVFVIPAAPSVNSLYRNVGMAERERARMCGRTLRGRRRTKDYNTWRRAAEWAMRIDGNKTRTWNTITGPVEVEIVTGNLRMDGDNGVKATLDILVSMQVIADDKQVKAHRVSQGGKPREAIVTVRALDQGISGVEAA